MTKDGNGKSKMLGRLIFGEKRKQQASPARHRSTTRNGGNKADVKTSHGADAANKDHINIHDWAVWRMHLNEQMSNGMMDQTELKQIRQFLQSNPFYQQYCRDPSDGRYNAVRLLFSIPHAKFQPELNDPSRGGLNKNSQPDVEEATTYEQHHPHPNIDDRLTTAIHSVPIRPPMPTDKTISQLLPRNLIANTDGFLHVDEQMIAAESARTRRSMRTSYTAADRVHSTLQKAVKDGNVLEKIKAFEMQAAAVQAELTPKLSRGGNNNMNNNRIQTVTSSVPSTAHRTLSPALARPIQHPISPLPIQHEPQPQQQQQHIRSHRSRHVHPVQHRRDGHHDPMVGRVSRKGAHVLEPAHGDVILKRRTSSQKTVNDDDYSMTLMSSMAMTASQSHHQHRPPHHHRASASRSRHRHETVPDKRSSSHHDHGQKKHAQKPKETTTPSSKTATRCRWLIGRKETSNDTDKQEPVTIKTSKTEQNKKKNNEKEKRDSSKRENSSDPKGKTVSTPDHNRVYDVPKPTTNDQTKSEPISSEPPSRIEEENESDRDEKIIVNKANHPLAKEEEKTIPNQECETISTGIVERRPSKTKTHQTLLSTDGEMISKIEDDTRFSRPTDDHAHHSELIDEDDECKSEGDVFLEESPIINIVYHHANQCTDEGISSDRHWQWSKESGGLTEKSISKKKQPQQQSPIPEQNINEDEIAQSEPNPTPKSETKPIISIESNTSKQMLPAKKLNPEQTTADEFFENGPHTNPEETFATKTSSA